MDATLSTDRYMATRWQELNAEQACRASARYAEAETRVHIDLFIETTGESPTDPRARDDCRQTLFRVQNNTAESVLSAMRRKFTADYGFAVITEEAVRWLSEILKGHRAIKVGAGNGCLAGRLKTAGVEKRAPGT